MAYHRLGWWVTRVAALALLIDLERCTGCKSCEAACKQSNALGPHEYRNKVLWFNTAAEGGGMADPPSLDFLTVTCQQCERPACVRACPVYPKVLTKDPLTAVVHVDESRCTGCGECALACPYGAMGYDPVGHHAVKCDLCAPRRIRGEGPACASVCPTRAIQFGERHALLAQAEADQRIVRDHDYFLQGPVTVYLERLRRDYRGDNSGAYVTTADRLGRSRPPALVDDSHPRQMLKQTTVGAVYSSVSPGSKKQDVTNITPGGCHICFNSCTVNFHVRDGRVINILGNANDPVFQGRICPKSQMTLQMYDNPHRLTQPLKRVGARGEGRFVAITWEQALDEIAERLNAVREEFGTEALAIHAGTRTGVLNIIGMMPLFARLWGTPNTATTEAFCDAGKVVALELTQGSTNLANIYTEDDIGSAGLYVYIGDNQAETRPVNFGMVNDWRIKNRSRMVVVDPRLTATASKADTWLPIRTGTDMALGLSLIFHLFETGKFDEAFCQEWVQGWREWRDFVIAQDYSPQWAAEITDLSHKDIQRLADDIAAAEGCMVFLSRGINQHTNSAQTNRVFMFLAAMTGNWGRKGGGYFNVAGEPDWQMIEVPPHRLTEDMRPAISNNPADWVAAMRGNGRYPIRALITGNNPLAQWPYQNAVRSAFAELDLIVHMECFKNETSMMADYVLPAASGVEKGGISRLAEDRRIVWNEKLIEPPGEARSDLWFWVQLGRRFGFDDVIKPQWAHAATFWDDAFRLATPDLTGATLKRLRGKASRWVRTPVADEQADEPGTLYLPGTTAFGAKPGHRFPTESGCLEFYNEALEARFNAIGLSALPEFYTEPEQLLGLPYVVRDHAAANVETLSPFFSKPVWQTPVRIAQPDLTEGGQHSCYDTELVTGRPPAPHFHSWTHYFWQAQEMWPELYCQIHPSKARAIQAKDGDRLCIETANGVIEARAWVTDGIRPTAVFIPIGWGEQQPFHPAQPVNLLTGLRLDPVSQQPNLKTHLCRVRRAVARN